jgi:hypothetical protein
MTSDIEVNDASAVVDDAGLLAAEAAGEVAEGAGEAGAKAASAVKAAISNPETAELIGAGFGELDKAYKMSVTEAKQGIMIASGLASAGCLALIPMLRVEIFRDFGQLAGVMFGSAYKDAEGFMLATTSIFGGIFNVMTVNLGAALQTEAAAFIGFLVVFIVGAVCVGLYVWLITGSGVTKMAEDEVREGNEAIPFAEIAKTKKNTVFVATTTITLSASAYLPVCQACAQILFCDKNAYLIQQINGKCSGNAYTGMSALAVVLILGFVIPLPIFLGVMIERFKPKGSPKNPDIAYDQDGEEVPFDDKVYNEIVEHDVNQQMVPFRSLYQGFEKDYSQWKVAMMVYKVLFVLPTIALSATASPAALAAFQVVLVTLQFFLVSQLAPFIDPMNDHMDFAGRLTGIVVGIGGLCVAVAPNSDATSIVGVIVMIANILNGLFMILAMSSGFPSVKGFVKNCRGTFTFSDTTRNLTDMPAQTAIRFYDVKKEIKHRVWQTWWNGVLLNKCGEDVPGRLVKLQKDTVDNGIATIKNHWDGEKNDEIRENRVRARADYEGVDLFWDDASGTRDGHLDSKTCFGKMYVKAYPFHLVVVYDDAADESFIEESDKLQAFLDKQETDDIKGRRVNRRSFRAIAASKIHVNYPFNRIETIHHVPDGTHTETSTDKDGNTHTRTVQDYSDIDVMIYYKNGVVTVDSNNNDKEMASGFLCRMHYADGHGDAIKPRTKEPFHVENRTAVMAQDHMGISDDWKRSDKMNTFLGKEECQGAIQEHMPLFEEELARYRKALADKALAENAILGDGFWYYVYNDPTLSRTALTAYLQGEANEVLRAIPESEAAGLDYLYKRMAIVQKDSESAAWFVFWEDFWLNNHEMSVVSPLAEFFDPSLPGAMCYHYCEKDKLLAFLTEHGLMSSVSEDSWLRGCVKQLFTPTDIEYLYLKCYGEPLPETAASKREKDKEDALRLRLEGASPLPAEEPTE